MKGKLIIIEAGDGSGKATQTEKLFQRLVFENYKVKKIEFPNYASESSALVKMYLNGEFGTDPDTISPYIASSFYAVDRYASFKKEWEAFYQEGGIILADRYTTSNMVHQAAKIDGDLERDKFLNWLYDFEYNIFGLPVPNYVIYLDMPPEYSFGLISKRTNKALDVSQDIHEADEQYLIKSYTNANRVASKYNWHKVRCISDNALKTIDEIHEEVYKLVMVEISRRDA
ncbi:thymidylate kinase [Desulfosporosinus fructosivorans]|uniref:Thymidylate kinase n=1 Tax=Desulfosporosinus fructosivorans TaxID=2018669 RepID=A0A4Z0R586_9FIRM|nr:thymidylate kinase [Desulfosporosinus fructosivorans]TGE36796.1 thymidylate kinase [Desulfosporosinus fructosivorans]